MEYFHGRFFVSFGVTFDPSSSLPAIGRLRTSGDVILNSIMPVVDQQQLQQFSHLELLARQVVEGFITGLHKSPFHGFSVEFAEHRLYNKGESTRHIDWKLFGRTDKLFVKRYEEETNLRCQIIIDNSSSMYYPVLEKKRDEGKMNKISFSVYCAAALIELLKRQRDAVGLSIFSEDVELHTAAKSSSLHQRMLYSEMEKMLDPISPDQHKKTFAIGILSVTGLLPVIEPVRVSVAATVLLPAVLRVTALVKRWTPLSAARKA